MTSDSSELTTEGSDEYIVKQKYDLKYIHAHNPIHTQSYTYIYPLDYTSSFEKPNRRK